MPDGLTGADRDCVYSNRAEGRRSYNCIGKLLKLGLLLLESNT